MQCVVERKIYGFVDQCRESNRYQAVSKCKASGAVGDAGRQVKAGLETTGESRLRKQSDK